MTLIVPEYVLKQRQAKEKAEKETKNKSLTERVPQPTGWRILVMPYMGKDQLALAPDPQLNLNKGFNYDPTLDPNSPEYQGPQGFLGQFGKGIESITFGGARPITEGTKGIMSLLEAQEAEKEMKDSVDQTGKNVSLMDSGANLGSAFNTDTNKNNPLSFSTVNTIGGMTKKEAEDIKRKLGVN